MVAERAEFLGLPTLTPEEAREAIDERARYFMRMGIDEFIARWQTGMYGNPDDNPDAYSVAFHLPTIGIDPWADVSDR